jgi:hypothetical protein
MKVRILTDVCDLSGHHKAGDEPDVVDERGAEYIANGIAEEVVTVPEAAMLDDAAERATLPRARPRG